MDLRKEEKEIRELDRRESEKYHELLGQEAGLKKKIEIEDEILRNLKSENRKMSEKMSTLHRNK